MNTDFLSGGGSGASASAGGGGGGGGGQPIIIPADGGGQGVFFDVHFQNTLLKEIAIEYFEEKN